MDVAARLLTAVSLTVVVGCGVAGCSSSVGPSSGRTTTSQSLLVKFPGSATFVATPVGQHDLSSKETLSIAKRANDELSLPADTVAIHGVLTDTTNARTPVWGFRFHACEVPHAAIKTVNRLCTRWVFLRADDGYFVEARYS